MSLGESCDPQETKPRINWSYKEINAIWFLNENPVSNVF